MRWLVLGLLLSSGGSMMAPFEYESVFDGVDGVDRGMVFCVYNGNYGWVRFSLSVVNLGDEMVFDEHNWGYFNAEVYDLDGEYLGDVRPGSDEGYLLFLAPGGVHIRTWMWDKRLYRDNVGFVLDEGVYRIVGVYRASNVDLRTGSLEFSFTSGSYYKPDMFVEDELGLSDVDKERITGVSFGLIWASVGVLAAGFVENLLLVYLGRRWELGEVRTVLWMATIVLCILLLGFTNSAEWIYRVFYK